MTEDIHSLAGPYVLNALNLRERSMYEAHLAECPTCENDLAELRRATARLDSGP